MKISFFIILITATCFTQRVISIEQQTAFRTTQTFPSTVKEVWDLNHTLDKFLGTWVGKYGNYTYQFNIKKIDYYNSYTDITADKLSVSFLIKDLSGNVVINSENSDLTRNIFWIGVNERNEHEFRLHDTCSTGTTAVMEPYYDRQLGSRDIENPSNLSFYVYKARIGTMTSTTDALPSCEGMAQYFPMVSEDNALIFLNRP